MQSKYTNLMQIGIIVRDVDASVKYYEDVLGIGPWEISWLSGEEGAMAGLTIDGKPREDRVCKLAITNIFGIELELVEPVGPSQYMDWLNEHGPGLHHVGVTIDGDYDQLLAEHKDKQGRDPWIRGVAFGGLMDFSYLDFREETGLIVECYRNIAPGRKGVAADYEGVLIEE